MGSPSILVVGGAGFVGSHTSKALAGAGFRPVVYDDLSNGHRDAVRWGPLEDGSLNDEARLSAVFAAHRPVAVICFAGFIESARSVIEPLAFYANNVAGVLTLMTVMERHGVDILVFSSSAAVYGEPVALPISESHPLIPTTPYGRSKLMVEQMLEDMCAAGTVRHASLRYFNAAGADPDGDLREAHSPETHLIPLALETAAGLRPHLMICGDDYPTPDGTCVRDYIHVSDLATAHVLATRRLLEGGAPLTVNVGTGRGHSVRDVVRAVEALTGQPLPTHWVPRRPGDVAALVADPALIRTELGWTARYAELDTIVTHAAAGYGLPATRARVAGVVAE